MRCEMQLEVSFDPGRLIQGLGIILPLDPMPDNSRLRYSYGIRLFRNQMMHFWVKVHDMVTEMPNLITISSPLTFQPYISPWNTFNNLTRVIFTAFSRHSREFAVNLSTRRFKCHWMECAIDRDVYISSIKLYVSGNISNQTLKATKMAAPSFLDTAIVWSSVFSVHLLYIIR